YNPSTDTWAPTSDVGAPSARLSHTAVWAANRMIIWGGATSIIGSDLDSGGRYDPATDSWTSVAAANAPAARSQHTAAWTGSEMIIWGGWQAQVSLGTGGRYNP